VPLFYALIAAKLGNGLCHLTVPRTQEPTFLHLQIIGLYRWVVSAKCLIAAARCMPVAMLNFVSSLAHWNVSQNEYRREYNRCLCHRRPIVRSR
jgi:hypothetical protein